MRIENAFTCLTKQCNLSFGGTMKALALFLGMLFVLRAEAKDHTGQITLGATMGALFETPWDTQPAKKAIGLGARYGVLARIHNDRPHAGFELAIDGFELLRSDMGGQVFTFNIFRRFCTNQKIQPIFSIGTGVSHNHNFFSSGTQDTPAFKFRGGVDIDLKPNIELGLYLEHFTVFKSRSSEPTIHFFSPVIALLYSFGDVSAEPTKEITVAKIEQNTADTDGDGVTDSKDRCANTMKGVVVNDLGCAAEQSFEMNLDVKFQTGTARLEAGELADLKSLAEILLSHPNLTIELQGFTDNKGSPAKNLALSQERAESVRSVLVKEYGVNPQNVTAKGYGEKNPIASNHSAEGRSKNRRVTAKIKT